MSSDRDDFRRKCVVAIFFHLILIIWTARNGSKFDNKRSSLQRARTLLADRLLNMIFSLPDRLQAQCLHPILSVLGAVTAYFFALVWLLFCDVFSDC